MCNFRLITRTISLKLAKFFLNICANFANISLKIHALCEGIFNIPFKLSNTFIPFINNTVFIAIFFKFIKL
ncbi:hypothetical protein BWK67_07200 [Campylobacter fetus]|nr:hypothetical protein BWK67_07200 [Campylobacter fetus]RUT49594.1 hypothetical protein BWK51_07180 [Campylobacter fetus]